MNGYILALDQGTSSSRAILFDKKGHVLGSQQVEFRQHYPKAGWVEHDPLEIFSSQLKAAANAVKSSGVCQKDIAAIGITNQRETTVIWEKATGRPVYNAIVWQCRRTAEICEQLERSGIGSYITEKTGLLIDAYFSGTKIKWILDNIPDARQRAEKGELLFGTIDSWLIWNLTKGRKHATDFTNASRTMLFDIDKLCWDEKLCRELSIPISMLPEVKPSSCVFGTVAEGIAGLEDLAGIPIASAVGDQQAALFGQACFLPGEAKNTYGTGCFLLMNIGERHLRSRNKLVTTIAWGEGGKVEYALEGSVFNAGSVIKWLRDELGMIQTSNEISDLAQSVPDTGGMYLVPAFTGLGAPYWDMYARGTMVGMTRNTNRAHFARAVIESIAYQVTDLIEAMQQDSDFPLVELRVDGGASVSDILMQFQADVLQTKIDRPRNVETTALGAAYLAGLAAGLWQNRDEIKKNRESERIFIPQMEPEERNEHYASWKRAVQRALNWEERR